MSYHKKERFLLGDSTQVMFHGKREQKLCIVAVEQGHTGNKIPEISHVILCSAVPNKYSLKFWGIIEESPMKIEVYIC